MKWLLLLIVVRGIWALWGWWAEDRMLCTLCNLRPDHQEPDDAR